MSCDFISDFIAPFVAPKWRIHTRIGEPLQSLGHLVTCNLLVSCTSYPFRTRSNNNRGKFKDTSPIGISSFQAQAYKHPKVFTNGSTPSMSNQRDGQGNSEKLPPCPPSILRNLSTKQKHRCRPVLRWAYHPNLKTMVSYWNLRHVKGDCYLEAGQNIETCKLTFTILRGTSLANFRRTLVSWILGTWILNTKKKVSIYSGFRWNWASWSFWAAQLASLCNVLPRFVMCPLWWIYAIVMKKNKLQGKVW